MKILVVSDNHGLTEELKQIKATHSVDYMIHCGDSELQMDNPLLDGFIKVAGNCDRDARFPNEQEIKLGSVKVLLTHGHLYDVKLNLTSLSDRGQEVEAHIVCFGHTHVAHVSHSKNQLMVNPGSIRQSKGSLQESYAIIECDDSLTDQTNMSGMVHFHTVHGERIESQPFHIAL